MSYVLAIKKIVHAIATETIIVYCWYFTNDSIFHMKEYTGLLVSKQVEANGIFNHWSNII